MLAEEEEGYLSYSLQITNRLSNEVKITGGQKSAGSSRKNNALNQESRKEKVDYVYAGFRFPRKASEREGNGNRLPNEMDDRQSNKRKFSRNAEVPCLVDGHLRE